jgi:hypothetical protein
MHPNESGPDVTDVKANGIDIGSATWPVNDIPPPNNWVICNVPEGTAFQMQVRKRTT